MDKEQEKRLTRKVVTIIFLAIAVNWSLFNLQEVKNIIGFIFSILTPFIIGTFIALLLNIPMTFFEKKLKRKNKNGEIRTNKILAMILSVICVLLVIIFVIMLIIPELIKIGNIIAENMPYYQEWLGESIGNLKTYIPSLDIENIKNTVISNLENIQTTLVNQLPQMLASSVNFVTGTFMTIVNFFIGVGFAFLLLVEKENLKIQSKKFLYAYTKKNIAKKIIEFVKTFITAFNRFIVVQCITAVILGALCITGSLILQIPYAFQIGILVGFTSLLPIIGVFIGIIISCILIVSVSPIKALIFAVLAILLWQIEENFIKPKIIGKKVGLPEIWIFIAMVVGISVLGFLGIFITIPFAAIIYHEIREKIEKTEIEEIEK